ncbi:MAG: PDZ domain-containing protein, partial [Chloroflexota bacterium]|nr:PDZ domain-containing protein [Chloroflexota bacterium]
VFLVFAAAAAPAALAAQITVRTAPRSGSYAYSWSSDESPRAVIGVTTSTGDARDTLGLLVTDVADGGPADKAGIQEGDRIQAVNGIDLKIERIDVGDQSMADAMSRRLTRELGKLKPGDDVSLHVYHNGQVKALSVKTVDSDSLYGNPVGLMSTMSQRERNRAMLGVSLAVTGSKRDTLGILVIGVTDNGPADKAGLEEGNRIAGINGVSLKVDREDAGDSYVANARYQRLQKEMAKVKPGDDVTLQVYADGRFKTVRLKAARASELGESGNAFIFRSGGDGGPSLMQLDVNGPLIR